MKRLSRRLAMETLGSRDMLASLVGDIASGGSSIATDDTYNDGRTITAENYDSALQRGNLMIISEGENAEQVGEKGIPIVATSKITVDWHARSSDAANSGTTNFFSAEPAGSTSDSGNT